MSQDITLLSGQLWGQRNGNREVFPENFSPLRFPLCFAWARFKKSLKMLPAPEVAAASYDPAP